MQTQPLPPILQEMIRQLTDSRGDVHYRENVCQRLEDVLAEVGREVRKFRNERVKSLSRGRKRA
jgi:hypothetical protein